MSVCQYFLQGRCAFGSQCRNVHVSRGNVRQGNARKEPEDVDPYNLLQRHWERLAWQGSPVWGKDPHEPAFHGLNLSIEELRWEFYQRPQDYWEFFQRNLEQQLENLRRAWIRHHNTNSFSRHTQQRWEVVLSNVFSGPQYQRNTCLPTNVNHVAPSRISRRSITPGYQSDIPMQTDHLSSFNTQNPLFQQAPPNQQLPQTSTFNAPFMPAASSSLFSPTPMSNQIFPPIPQSPLATLPPTQLTPSSAAPAFEPSVAASLNKEKSFDAKIRYLQQHYPQIMNDYNTAELTAFLAPHFSFQAIPTKPPPSYIPELL